MPTQKEVTVRYWVICKKWRIPYPCRKTKTTVKWCYFFSIWTQTNYLLVARHKACEDNKQYSWFSAGLGAGTIVHVPQEKCFSSELEGKDGCSLIGTQTPFSEP